MSQFRYSAFVSYSHKDDKAASWLLKALETFKVPRRLVGKPGPNGPIPHRLPRIFRDREELAAGANLDEKIQEALRECQTLLVVCSRNAAASFGVNREIEYFRAIRGNDHIFYIILDGEPHAAARGLAAELECFPPAMLDHSLDDATPYGVPLAADMRPEGDGKHMALLKVVAGILGLNLDSLARRDLQRRQRNLVMATVALSLGMTLTGGLAVQSYLANKWAEEALSIARTRHEESEKLIRYMLGELQDNLRAVARLDLLSALGDQVTEYYARQNPEHMTATDLANQISAMSTIAEVYHDQGEFAKGEAVARQLYGTASRLAAQHPNDHDILDTVIETLLQLASIRYEAGDFVEAKHLLEEKLQFSKTLADVGPLNYRHGARLANSYVHLGILELNYSRRPDLARDLIAKGLKLRLEAQRDFTHSPEEVSRGLSNIAGAYQHLSLAEEALGLFEAAEKSRQKALEVFTERTRIDPDNVTAKYTLHRHETWIARLKLLTGDTEAAIAISRTAAAGFAEVFEAVPDHAVWEEYATRAALVEAQALLLKGNADGALARLADAPAAFFSDIDTPDPSINRRSTHIMALTLQGQAYLQQGNKAKTAEKVTAIAHVLGNFEEAVGNTLRGRRILTDYWMLAGDAAASEGDMATAEEYWHHVLDRLGSTTALLHPQVRLARLEANMRLGQFEQAQELAQQLAQMGFARPDFLQAMAELADRLPQTAR